MLPIVSAALSIALLCGASYIPAAGAKTSSPATAAHKSADPVDINRASLAELMQVPGITRVWAERIVRFRPYRTKQDLLDEGILPGAVYARIKDSIIAHRPKQQPQRAPDAANPSP